MLSKAALVLPTTYRQAQFSINDSIERRSYLLQQAIMRARTPPSVPFRPIIKKK